MIYINYIYMNIDNPSERERGRKREEILLQNSICVVVPLIGLC